MRIEKSTFLSNMYLKKHSFLKATIRKYKKEI